MVEQILRFDFTITELINNILPHNQFFDAVFSFFSLKGVNTLFWILLGAVWIFIAEKKSTGFREKDKKFVILFGISLLTTAFLVNIVLKNIIDRPRPVASTVCPDDFSFPSGHAAIAFAATAVLSAFDKKRKYIYYFIAFLVALSRVYLGCHYFLDVVTGAIIGYAIGRITRKVKNNN